MTMHDAKRNIERCSEALRQVEALADSCQGLERSEYRGLAIVYRSLLRECEHEYADACTAAGVQVSR